jgi:hypothetical protein
VLDRRHRGDGEPDVVGRVPVTLLLCSPPYEVLTATALTGEQYEPTYGSVVCATGHDILGMAKALEAAARQWPWISLCMVLCPNEGVSTGSMGLAGRLSEGLALCIVRDSGALRPVHIIQAIAFRDPPNPSALAIWAAARLNAKEALGALEEQFTHAVDERPTSARSAATYSRLFRRHASLTARDWRALARLVHALHAALQRRLSRQSRSYLTVSAVSHRTVARYASTYLGMRWAAATQLIGWEWVMECALKRRGVR